jgi:hypothetical protein
MSTGGSGTGGAGGSGSFGTSGMGSGTSGEKSHRRREDASVPSRKLPRVKRATKPQQSEERSGPPK